MLFAREFGGEINHEKERLAYGVAYEILHFKNGMSVLALKRSRGTVAAHLRRSQNVKEAERRGEAGADASCSPAFFTPPCAVAGCTTY